MQKERIERAVSAYYEAMRNRDLEAWLDLFSEDVVSHSPAGGPVIEGRDGMRLAFKTILNTLEEVKIGPESTFICGAAAAVKWTARGVGHNGRAVTFEGINIFEIDLHGRIRRIDAYWDPNTVMRQLNS